MLLSEIKNSQEPSAVRDVGRKKRRHPLVARSKAAVGILVHAATRPHKAAIIDLNTGDVKPIDG